MSEKGLDIKKMLKIVDLRKKGIFVTTQEEGEENKQLLEDAYIIDSHKIMFVSNGVEIKTIHISDLDSFPKELLIGLIEGLV